jgi:hypothetical protein
MHPIVGLMLMTWFYVGSIELHAKQGYWRGQQIWGRTQVQHSS